MLGTVLLWILLGLLGLLLLLLLLPASVYIELQGGQLRLRARVLFVVLRLYPPKQLSPQQQQKREQVALKKQQRAEARAERKTQRAAAKAARKAPPESEDETPEKNKKKERTPAEWLQLIKRLAASAGAALRIVLRGLFIRDVVLVLPVSAGEPADTAVRVGQLQAAVGGVRAALQNLLHIRYKRLMILPNFAGEREEDITFSCKIVASPVIMLAAGVLGLWHFLRYGRPVRRRRLSRRQLRKRVAALKKERAVAAKQQAEAGQTA